MAYFERLTVYALAAVLQVNARLSDLVTVWLLTSYGVKPGSAGCVGAAGGADGRGRVMTDRSVICPSCWGTGDHDYLANALCRMCGGSGWVPAPRQWEHGCLEQPVEDAS